MALDVKGEFIIGTNFLGKISSILAFKTKIPED
jgi:hypothetical protein